jgi:type II secretory pathway pseudopilin PulG
MLDNTDFKVNEPVKNSQLAIAIAVLIILLAAGLFIFIRYKYRQRKRQRKQLEMMRRSAGSLNEEDDTKLNADPSSDN